MSNIAFKISVWESEKGHGDRHDDYMICLSAEDALDFKNEFNAKNNLPVTPVWYMQVRGEPSEIKLSDSQFKKLNESSIPKRIWWSELKNQ